MKQHTVQLIEGRIVTGGTNIVFPDGDTFRLNVRGAKGPVMIVVSDDLYSDALPENHYQTDAKNGVTFSGGIDAVPEGESLYWTAKEYSGSDQTTVAMGTFTKYPANRSIVAPKGGIGLMAIGINFQVA